MKKEWLDKLQTRVQNEHDVKAPEGLLDDIKKEMARRGVAPVPPARKKARRLSLWLYRSVSVAAVVAVCLYLGNILISPYSMPEQIASVTKDKANSNPNTPQSGHVMNHYLSSSEEAIAPILERDNCDAMNLRVIFCSGAAKIEYTSPCSTTRPFSITATLWQIDLITAISCVIRIIVRLSFLFSVFSSVKIDSVASRSRALVAE